GDGDDLVLELAGLLSRLGLVLRENRELVLLRAGDLVLARDVLGGVAHVVAVEGIPQAILDHGVDQFDAAHLDAATQILRVRGHAHGFLAAGDHDFRIAVEQRLIAERYRAQAAAAKLVDAPGRAFHRNTGSDRGLAGRVLALGRGQDLAHDDFGDAARLNAGPLQRGLDGDGAEVMGRHGGERAVETADRGAGGADDDDIVGHENFLRWVLFGGVDRLVCATDQFDFSFTYRPGAGSIGLNRAFPCCTGAGIVPFE